MIVYAKYEVSLHGLGAKKLASLTEAIQKAMEGIWSQFKNSDRDQYGLDIEIEPVEHAGTEEAN